MSSTLPRQNYHIEAEAFINRQINLELHASYVFLSMAAYFDRDDVALPVFSKYFRKLSKKERKDAVRLIEYQNQRGGRVVFQPIEKPDADDWGSGLKAMEKALQLERNLNESLQDINSISLRHADAETSFFIKREYLDKQSEIIYEISNYIANLKKVGPGLGEYLFDKQSMMLA